MFGKVDIVCGGFPCQSFSQAGDGEGSDHKDKGALFFDTARLIGDLAPESFILENVEALGTDDEGKTFDTILDILTDLGYAVQTCVLNSGEFGLAQNRLRMCIVGIHDRVLANRTAPFQCLSLIRIHVSFLIVEEGERCGRPTTGRRCFVSGVSSAHVQGKRFGRCMPTHWD